MEFQGISISLFNKLREIFLEVCTPKTKSCSRARWLETGQPNYDYEISPMRKKISRSDQSWDHPHPIITESPKLSPDISPSASALKSTMLDRALHLQLGAPQWAQCNTPSQARQKTCVANRPPQAIQTRSQGTLYCLFILLSILWLRSSVTS